MKYPPLANQEWLCEKYLKEKLSTVQIAILVGCSVQLVNLYLKKYNIPIRSGKESRALQAPRIFRYQELENVDWLRQKYETEGLSTLEIAELVGAKTGNSVRQALLRHKIEVRNRSDGQTINREEDYFQFNQPIIEGSLLGDGSLDIWNRESDISFPYFHKKNIHYEHALYVASKIFSKNPESRISEYKRVIDGKTFGHFWLCSLTYKELLPFYRLWYPKENNYKKVIPENIEINEELLLHMFLDDGTTFLRRPESKKKQVVITLCSQSFSRENQEMFCEKVYSKFALKMSTTPCANGTGYMIRIPQSNADLFYEIIGPSPVQCLSYKWK